MSPLIVLPVAIVAFVAVAYFIVQICKVFTPSEFNDE